MILSSEQNNGFNSVNRKPTLYLGRGSRC